MKRQEGSRAGEVGPEAAADEPTTATGPRPGRSVDRVVALRGAISLINRFPALAGIDLTVGQGEIVLLRGPNGAGKTTLLRLVAGLAALSGGTGTVLGHDLADRRHRRELRHHTGLLAHQSFLYDELTVEENLRFWTRANRLEPSSVEPVLDRLALNNRLRRVRVGHLSAGQRRRVSLAVLVSRRPRLWLLDEPHAGLDAHGRDFVDGLVGHAVSFGATVLFASHDLDRADEIASRTVVVAGGQVREDLASVSSLLPVPDGAGPDVSTGEGSTGEGSTVEGVELSAGSKAGETAGPTEAAGATERAEAGEARVAERTESAESAQATGRAAGHAS